MLKKYIITCYLRSGFVHVELEMGILVEMISWRITLKRMGARERSKMGKVGRRRERK